MKCNLKQVHSGTIKHDCGLLPWEGMKPTDFHATLPVPLTLKDVARFEFAVAKVYCSNVRYFLVLFLKRGGTPLFRGAERDLKGKWSCD